MHFSQQVYDLIYSQAQRNLKQYFKRNIRFLNLKKQLIIIRKTKYFGNIYEVSSLRDENTYSMLLNIWEEWILLPKVFRYSFGIHYVMPVKKWAHAL